ncbi:MAG: hypothetical protein LBD23_15425 [Oscillospiraceae bacterium]|jgi:hypothetical protein|nr:hypothetical protein [Oscillospiraceae bacterium]
MKRPLKKAIAFFTTCAFMLGMNVTTSHAATMHDLAHYAVNSIFGNNYNAFVNIPNANLLISGAKNPSTSTIEETPWSRLGWKTTEVIDNNSIMDMVTSEGEVIRVRNSVSFTKFARINSGHDWWKRWEWQTAENNAGYAIIDYEHIIVMDNNDNLALLMNNGTFFNDGTLYDNIDVDSNGFWYFSTGRVITVYSPSMVAVVSQTFNSASDLRMQWLSSTQYGEYYEIFGDYYTIDGVPAPVGFNPWNQPPVIEEVEISKAMNTRITASYISDGQTISIPLGINVDVTGYFHGKGDSGGGVPHNVTFYNGDRQPIITIESFSGSAFTQDYLVVYGLHGLASIDLDSETLIASDTGGFFSGFVIVASDNTVVLERGELSVVTSEFGTYSVATNSGAYRLYCAVSCAALSTSYSSFSFGTDSSNGTIYIVTDSSENQGLLNRRGFTLVEPGEYAGIVYLEVDITIFKTIEDTTFTIINTTNGRIKSGNVYINYILPPPERYFEGYWRTIRIKLPHYRHSNGNYSIVTTNENGSEYGLLFFRRQ